jgi:hypothetical protein
MKRTLVHFFVFLLLVLPTVSFAQDEGLVPCGGEGDPECQACHVVQLAQNILTWVINIMASIIALIFVIGGIKMVMSAGDTGAVKQARKMITNSVIGFIILLTAWLIMDTVLKTFVNEGAIGPWHQVECVPPPTYTTAPAAGTVTPLVGAGPGTGLAPGAEKLTDAQARELLAAAGITINKTAEQGTSLDGMNIATVNDAIKLKSACGCVIVITGGTESTGGHTVSPTGHAAGFKYDVRPNPALDTFITTNYTTYGVRSDGAQQYYDANTGVIYAREGDHWDVKVGG